MKNAQYFVIDTDEYAGNFERELCAYVTGVIGDCGVADKIASKVEDDPDVQKIGEYISQEADEHGCYRPCKIYPTPNVFNNGLGFEYKIGEEDLAREAYTNRCNGIAKEQLKQWASPEYAKQQHDEWIEKGKNPEIGKYPAYQSVAIVLDDIPPEELLVVMKERAKQFAEAARDGNAMMLGARFEMGGFNIVGFRLTEEEIVVSESDLGL